MRNIAGMLRKHPIWVVGLTALAPPQADSTFEVLAVPPSDVGSCVAPLVSQGADSTRSRRLLIKSLSPGNHRDINLLVNSNGQPIGVTDGSFVMQDDLRGVGTNITAILLARGGVYGNRLEIRITLPEQVRESRDVAEIQGLVNQASRSTSTRPLDAADEKRVYALVEFLRKRCPP